MPLDSRSLDSETHPYINSADPVDAWGQPPASYYSFRIVDGIMVGEPIRDTYMPELHSWESLGIEDWINFESTLEDNQCLT